MGAILALAVFSFIFVYLLKTYNQLVRQRNLVKNSFSQIDVQLKRRYDLIPNLVETAKAYLKHEKETLESVIRARNHAFGLSQSLAQNPSNGDQMKTFLGAELALNQSLQRLMAVAESYPDLKANATIGSLMEELTSTENKVSFARQAFNDSVMSYNNSREIFPNSLIATAFQFQSAQPFEVTNAKEKENIKVKFN